MIVFWAAARARRSTGRARAYSAAGKKRRGGFGRHPVGEHRAQEGIAPHGLAPVGQDEIQDLLGVVRVRSALHEPHHVREYDRALLGNHEADGSLVGVLAAVGVEIIVEEDGDLSRDHPRVRGLLRHDRLVLGELPEVGDGWIDVGVASPEGQVHRHHAHLADRGAGGIEVSDQSLVIRLEQILPGGRHRLATERRLVHEEAQRTRVDGEPVAVGVLQSGRDPFPAVRLVRCQHTCFLGGKRDAATEIHHVGDGSGLLGDERGQRLARVLVVGRHRDAERLLNGLELRPPVCPLGRAVVTDRALLGVRGAHSRENGQTHDHAEKPPNRPTHHVSLSPLAQASSRHRLCVAIYPSRRTVTAR